MERLGLHGTVLWHLRGADGSVKATGIARNLVTQVGDQFYGERAAGIESPPGQLTGMKLGEGSDAPTKTGAGAALGVYLSDSHQAIEAGFPTSALESGARRITWQAVWAAGKATSANPITEVVLVNDTLADTTSPEGNTVARALLNGIAAKGADDTLTVTWQHDLAGS